jgi:hypothetical protein
MASTLQELQESVVALIAQRPFFTPVPVLYERLKDLRTELVVTLKSKTGICILVGTPKGANKTPGSPSVTLDATLNVDVLENVLFNQSAKGTRLGANEVGEQLAAHLHHGIWTGGKALSCVDIDTIERDGLVRCRVRFATLAQLGKQ